MLTVGDHLFVGKDGEVHLHPSVSIRYTDDLFAEYAVVHTVSVFDGTETLINVSLRPIQALPSKRH